MKYLLILFLSLSVIFICFLFIFKNENKPNAIIENKVFILDVARSKTEKELGLAKYNKLPENKAMLFVFNTSSYYSFWMKNMKFPIDIIFIKDDKIVDIFPNVPYPKTQNSVLPIYTSKAKANYVLETNANISKKYNFKVGSVVKINL